MNDQGGCLHGCGASPEPGIGHPQPDRASGLDEGACVLRSQVLAFARDVHVGVNHRLVDTRWLGANKLQRALHERFGSKPAQLPVEQRLRKARHRQCRHHPSIIGSGRRTWTPGIAGSTSTSELTQSGWAEASRIAMCPPIELPMRLTGRATTFSMKSWTRAALAPTVAVRPNSGVCPKPARSMASAWCVRAICGATAIQFRALPARP